MNPDDLAELEEERRFLLTSILALVPTQPRATPPYRNPERATGTPGPS